MPEQNPQGSDPAQSIKTLDPGRGEMGCWLA
jgi:hypothetical protein